MLTAEAPPGAPAAAAVMARAGGENFPVASRVLPRRARSDLLALYGFARLVDEVGDSLEGDRPAALDWLEQDLDRAFAGEALHPLLRSLQPTLRAHELTPGPFVRLIDANRQDQRVSRYETWEELAAYCTLSADPVGELVLGVLELATPERISLSNSICTALQLIEHCQDVSEDLEAGRVYLPREDLARFGCSEADLGAAVASEPVRRVLAFELERAHRLLDAGSPLIGQLRGRARVAVAAFAAGGRSAAQAIERAGFDVLGGAPPVSHPRRLQALARTLRGAGQRP